MEQFVCLSGLPRAGSTLLSAILSQNPLIHAEGNSAVCQLMWDIQQSCLTTSKEQLLANGREKTTKHNLISQIPNIYYKDIKEKIVLDKCRSWTINANISMLENYIDKNVEKRYGTKIKKAFANVNKEVKYITLDANESVKSMSSLTENILLLEKLGLSRFDCLVGIGGGVLIDLISFMASVYMRGVPLILIPTTLMGQVDATTAGKTCINSPSSKNLLGTLYFAKKVYINTTFISSLPTYELRQAFSEIFKYSLLNSAKLLNLLIKYKKEPIEKTLIEVISETIKSRISNNYIPTD